MRSRHLNLSNVKESSFYSFPADYSNVPCIGIGITFWFSRLYKQLSCHLLAFLMPVLVEIMKMSLIDCF